MAWPGPVHLQVPCSAAAAPEKGLQNPFLLCKAWEASSDWRLPEATAACERGLQVQLQLHGWTSGLGPFSFTHPAQMLVPWLIHPPFVMHCQGASSNSGLSSGHSNLRDRPGSGSGSGSGVIFYFLLLLAQTS